jgi:osmotically inducible protein OsmC
MTMFHTRRIAQVEWTGEAQSGRGEVSTQSGALVGHPYGFHSRFGDVAGTNPEELLAAAHASCFTMALVLQLEEAGYTADRIETRTQVTLAGDGRSFEISKVAVSVVLEIADATDALVQRVAFEALQVCPTSKLFNIDVDLETRLALPGEMAVAMQMAVDLQSGL